jgi:hypothetical protein
MAMSALRAMSQYRRHGVTLEPADRRALERAGWRTTLEYRENHVRGRDGRLLEVEESWTAEAERFDGAFQVVAAEGATAEEAWAVLREEIATTERPPSRVRLVHP